MKRLDSTDISILSKLQEDARITNVDLAKAVHLSATPCFNRVKSLEGRNLINRYVTLLNPAPLWLHVNVFIQVSLEKQTETALGRFEKAIQARAEVMECYLMSGDSDYLLRVLVKDVTSLERFIIDSLAKIPGISNIRSSFALKQVKYKTALPLPAGGLTLFETEDEMT